MFIMYMEYVNVFHMFIMVGNFEYITMYGNAALVTRIHKQWCTIKCNKHVYVPTHSLLIFI